MKWNYLSANHGITANLNEFVYLSRSGLTGGTKPAVRQSTSLDRRVRRPVGVLWIELFDLPG